MMDWLAVLAWACVIACALACLMGWLDQYEP